MAASVVGLGRSLKDMNAEVTAVRAGFKPRSAVINEMGYDEEDVDRQAAADNARADSLGLTFDSDPRRTTGNGQRVSEPEPAPELATQVQ